MKLSTNNFSILILLLFISIDYNIGNVINYSLSKEGDSGGNEIDITTKRTTTKSPSSNLDTNRIEDNDHGYFEDKKRKTIKYRNRREEKVCEKTIVKEHGYNYELINVTIDSQLTDEYNNIIAYLEFFVRWKETGHTQRLCTEYSWLSQTGIDSCNIEECLSESEEYESDENNF